MSSSRGVWRDERGSGSLLGLAIVVGVVLVLGMIIPVAQGLAIKQRVVGAADAAALAAADTVTGRVSGVACDRADDIALHANARIDTCVVTGTVVTVTVATRYLIFDVEARSRAGPPGTK